MEYWSYGVMRKTISFIASHWQSFAFGIIILHGDWGFGHGALQEERKKIKDEAESRVQKAGPIKTEPSRFKIGLTDCWCWSGR
jgi:hypothetical protein